MEIQILLLWYLAFVALGIIGLPITNLVFKNWPDHGYGFAKFIGMFVIGMFIWFLSSLRIIPVTDATIWLVFISAFFISAYFITKQEITITKHMIIEEALFFIVLLIWAYIRSANPRVEGTEKFMNYAFMSSIARTEYFPPADPWYAGGTINYYYLGHYYFTLVARLTSIGIEYAYNLALITIIAQTFTGLYAIFNKAFEKSHLAISISLSALGATWLSFGGNMHYFGSWFYTLFTSNDFSYYFPDATRIIPNTINEFPAYSIVLGDVHGHYLGLPFMVIVIALFMASTKINIKTMHKVKFNAIISLLIMSLYGINTWDFITANSMFMLLHIYQAARIGKTDLVERFIHFAKAEVALLVPGAVLMLPYLLNFESPLVGEGSFFLDKYLGSVPLFLYQNKDTLEFNKFAEIRPWLAMWGMFLFITISFYALRITGMLKKQKSILVPALLTLVSFGLVLGVELFFFKDIFHTSNPPFFRTNTVFKFYYHAWITWGVASVWYVYLMIVEAKKKTWYVPAAFLTVITIMFFGSIAYIHKAVSDFYPPITETQLTLEGNHFMEVETDKIGDYQAVSWINENIEGQPVIIEAVGDAYTYFARVSTTTGLKTIMGWPTHEWQWRGESTTPFARKTEVEQFYNATSVEEMYRIINLYDVEYIYVGSKEFEVYPNLNEQLIMQIADVVYSNDYNTRIYKVRGFNQPFTNQSVIENTSL